MPDLNPQPFVKWAGGKRQLLPEILRAVPHHFNRYFEPFVGGGAVFMDLTPSPSILVDNNPELMNCYRVIRDSVEELIDLLREHRRLHSEEHYYRTRGLWSRKPRNLGLSRSDLVDPESLSPTERAARFIYLNRTCYNGLYRVNSRGQFNVPFGRHKNPPICDEPNLREVSRALRITGAELVEGDFEMIREYDPGEGDLIYFDPPYVPLSETSDFTSYTSEGFAAGDQRRLAELFRHADRAGAHCILSNSDSDQVRKLYSGFKISTVSARRAVNSRAEGRGEIDELLITNY